MLKRVNPYNRIYKKKHKLEELENIHHKKNIIHKTEQSKLRNILKQN